MSDRGNAGRQGERRSAAEGWLTEPERAALLSIAREAVLQAAASELVSAPRASGRLAEPAACFVTLRDPRGALRGCIGTIEPRWPLAEAVARMAEAAAIRDGRFRPVEPEEAPTLGVEISVLGPARALEDPAALEVGAHGLVVTRGAQRGVYLPEVASAAGWSRREYLEQTCAKAGLPPDAWRRDGTVLEIFETHKLSDHDPD